MAECVVHIAGSSSWFIPFHPIQTCQFANRTNQEGPQGRGNGTPREGGGPVAFDFFSSRHCKFNNESIPIEIKWKKFLLSPIIASTIHYNNIYICLTMAWYFLLRVDFIPRYTVANPTQPNPIQAEEPSRARLRECWTLAGWLVGKFLTNRLCRALP